MKTVIVFIILVSITPPCRGQDRLLLYAAPGLSLSNSENSMKVIGDKSVGWFPGLGIAYETENLWGLKWHFGYNYSRAKVDDVLDFVTTGPGGPTPIASYGANLVLATHSLDIGLYTKPFRWLSLGAGPTVALINRSIQIDQIPSFEGPPTSFEDRLASVGVGFHAAASGEIAFEDQPPFFFAYSTLKIRFLQAIWFDQGERNLDNYHQSFFIGQWGFGLGYCF